MDKSRLGEVYVTDAEASKAKNNDLARQLSHSKQKKSISETVEEKQAGEVVSKGETEAILGNATPQSEEHPDHDEKSTAQKYRERYSEYWSDETKEDAKELYKKRGDGE